MELIVNLIEMGVALLKVLFAVPILGIMVMLGTFGPMLIKAIKHR